VLACQIDAEGLDAQFLQTLNVQLKYDTRFSCFDGEMRGGVAPGCSNAH
jgi:hypothetical protein